MSIPLIPGYTSPHSEGTLAQAWGKPDGELPEVLWPRERLEEVVRNPTGWVKLVENFYNEAEHGGAGCILIRPEDASQALERTSWFGRDLGNFGLWDSGRVDQGLEGLDGETRVEFLAQVRRPSGSKSPIVEISMPFLWFWDAYRVDDGWRYLNRAGREQELVRWNARDDEWIVEVRALELRQFLFRIGRTVVLQRDYVQKRADGTFERVDSEHRSDWAHFHFWAESDGHFGSRPVTAGLMGQFLVSGVDTERAPRFLEREAEREFPEFIYGTDATSGRPLRHSADPDKLGTYYDRDGTRLHYLTPVYFKREVLQPYAAEPSRYSVSPSRLACLDLWGLDISINSVGLVEAYLGDLGRDLPSDEWGHWLSYNVSPEGQMEEGRFRRDFLNQWATSPDPVRDLRAARENAAEKSSVLLGSPIWRPLEKNFSQEFESLVGPLTDDPSALATPVLILTKALVDSIDPTPLKQVVPSAKDERSLSLLQKWAEQLGDEDDVTAPLRQLQALRSRGGVAHLRNSQSDRAASELGILGKPPLEAFNSIVEMLAMSLDALTALMEARLPLSED